MFFILGRPDQQVSCHLPVSAQISKDVTQAKNQAKHSLRDVSSQPLARPKHASHGPAFPVAMGDLFKHRYAHLILSGITQKSIWSASRWRLPVGTHRGGCCGSISGVRTTVSH